MNKNTCISIIALNFLCLTLTGQQNFASISFGATLPQDDYGATGDLSSNGYARTGGGIKFDAGYFPGSYFGIGGSFSFGSNFAVGDSLQKDMITHIEENAASIIDIPEEATVDFQSGFWNYINIFIGPHFSIRASQRLYLDFRGLAGMSILRQPDQELSIIFPGTSIYNRTSKNRLAFGFSAGGGLRYKLNSSISFKLGADFFQSRAKFDNAFDIIQGVADDVPVIESDFLVRAVELTAGLAYSF